MPLNDALKCSEPVRNLHLQGLGDVAFEIAQLCWNITAVTSRMSTYVIFYTPGEQFLLVWRKSVEPALTRLGDEALGRDHPSCSQGFKRAVRGSMKSHVMEKRRVSMDE